MIFFELYRQLDIRIFQTISAVDQTYGSCAKYVFDRDSLVLLGMNHSIRLDILTKEVKKDNPIRNWDIESETVMWFAEDSAEAALIRLINDAYRKWMQLDANISDEYFAMELEQVNQILAIMAPALMSGVSEAASGATVSQQNTAQASPSFMPGAAPGIFSALLGTSPSTQIQEASQEDNSAINGVALLQALLNARK